MDPKVEILQEKEDKNTKVVLLGTVQSKKLHSIFINMNRDTSEVRIQG
jgi:hypothetical protein